MSRAFTHILRIVTCGVFAGTFIFFLITLLNPGFLTIGSVGAFFTNLKVLVSCGLYALFYYLSYGVSAITVGLFGVAGTAYFNGIYAGNVTNGLLNHFLLQWFSFPAVPDSTGTIMYYMTGIEDLRYYFPAVVAQITTAIYTTLFIALVLIAIANITLFAFRMKATYSLNAVMSMAGMVILPLALTGLENLLAFFGQSWPVLANLPTALQATITQPITEGWGFFTNGVFFVALLLYLCLELSYQVEYADQVTKPSEEREERLRYQLEALRRESSRVTTTIEKIQTQVKEKKKEMGSQGNRLRQFFSKAGGFSYVKEMVEKRKFEKSTQRWLEAASDTRRLGSYVERLMTEDPEARRTLTAKSSAPTAGKMLTSTLLNIAVRTVAVTLLTFIVIQPQFILNSIFFGPNTPLHASLENGAILQSAEIHTPEAILTILIPLLGLFPVASIIIKRIKQQRLKELLRQEQARREAAEQAIFAARTGQLVSGSSTTGNAPETIADDSSSGILE